MPFSGEDAMNWKKLSKEKKQQLLLIAMVTIGTLAGLGWGLIKGQYEYIGSLADKKVATQKKLEQVEQAVKRTKQIEEELAENRKTLSEQERDVAEGDLYAWEADSTYVKNPPYFDGMTLQPAPVEDIKRFDSEFLD
jgi:aconitase A